VPVERSAGDGVSGEAVRLLWTGSKATLGYLEAIARPLAALFARRPQVTLTVLADRAPGELGLPTAFVPFSLASEEAALARADVGLMPLGGDAWSRGKCGLKLALYMAWGLPAVASRAGAGAELADAPLTALLADDEGEWLASLESLVASPSLRRAMGARARGDAAARLSLDARARSWALVLREAIAIGEERARRA
jgi:glycosyltransferase involved in cell wall biosynthesis